MYNHHTPKSVVRRLYTPGAKSPRAGRLPLNSVFLLLDFLQFLGLSWSAALVYLLAQGSLSELASCASTSIQVCGDRFYTLWDVADHLWNRGCVRFRLSV